MNFLKRHTWSVILLGVIISFAMPVFGILMSPFLHPLFMMLMFLSTLSINFSHVVSDLKHPKKIILLLILIHLVSPLIVFATRFMFTQELYVGLIIATSVPSGISAIFLTHIFKGDTTQALITTTLSSLLSPLLVPLSIRLFAGSSINVDTFGLIMTSAKLIIVPFICAQYISRTSLQKTLTKHSDTLNVALLFCIIIAILSPVRSYLTESLLLTLFLSTFIATLIVANFALGFALGKTLPEKIAGGLNAGFKNFALAMVLALTYFNGVVALPPIIYALVTSVLLIPLEWYVDGLRTRHT